jgi:hypothetical protein
MNDIAYNAGLEIRYAIASSGVDPIQHIPEVDAIIDRRLAEARRQAFIEAAEIAENHSELRGIEWWLNATKKEVSADACRSIAAALRKAAEV